MRLSLRRYQVALLVLAGSCAAGSASSEGENCENFASTFGARDAEVVACRTIGAGEFLDVRASQRMQQSCRLGNGVSVRTAFDEEDRVNPHIILEATEAERRLDLEPKSRLQTKYISVTPMLDCDAQGRGYVAQPLMGYVIAINRDGEELWRLELTPFRRLDDDPDLRPSDIPSIMQAFATPRVGLADALVVSGDVLAVQWRNGLTGWNHAFVHRSGKLLAQIGPWDALLLGSTPGGGWVFAVGGGNDIRHFVAKREVVVRLNSGAALSTVIDHSLAWLEPRPTEKEFRVECAARLADEIRPYLGERYDPAVAELSLRVFAELIKGGRFVSAASRLPLRTVIERYTPPGTDEWRRAYRDALQQSGVDVVASREVSARELAAASRRAAREGIGESALPEAPTLAGSPRVLGIADVQGVDNPVNVRVERLDISKVFEILSVVTGVQFTLDRVRERKVPAAPGHTLGEVLEKLGASMNLVYEVRSPTLVYVRDRTNDGQLQKVGGAREQE